MFALPKPRVGLAALGDGIQRPPVSIGLHYAMAMMLIGWRVTAAEGLALGFVAEVVETDVLGAARRWAAEILACSPMSVWATKQAVLRDLAMPIEQSDYPAMRAMLASQDNIEGPVAFAEKRPPRWRGADAPTPRAAFPCTP